MKRLCLIAIVLSAGLLSIAYAADAPTTKPAPAPVAEVQADGSILLKPQGARIHGFHLQVVLKPETVLAYWVDNNEYPEWPKAVAKKGKYNVEITYSCPQRAGGDFMVVAAANRLTATTQHTVDWHTFTTHKLENLTVLNDDTTISVRCGGRLDHALMNIQSIKLIPIVEKEKK